LSEGPDLSRLSDEELLRLAQEQGIDVSGIVSGDEEHVPSDLQAYEVTRASELAPVPEEEPENVPAPSGPPSDWQEQKIRDELGYSPSEKRTQAERNAAAERILGEQRAGPLTEESYVAHQLAITRLQMQQGLKDPDGKRLERCEAYARWRWKGFHAGEIASL
jgi:hypothetical protein